MSSENLDPDDELGNELDAEWRADRLAHRLRTLRSRRPVKLRDAGPLDPRIAAWGQALVAGATGNLIIVGKVGRIKTWSAWEVLEQAVAAGYAGGIDFANDADWQEAVGPPPNRDRLRAMRAAPLLVLDDLGSTRINDYQRDLLGPVVNDRWENGRPIVITTNMESLTDPLGERMASRLKDGATLVVLGGEDRRRGR
jgi:DNA replication protein DnaC